jgi:hypothetical protein
MRIDQPIPNRDSPSLLVSLFLSGSVHSGALFRERHLVPRRLG